MLNPVFVPKPLFSANGNRDTHDSFHFPLRTSQPATELIFPGMHLRAHPLTVAHQKCIIFPFPLPPSPSSFGTICRLALCFPRTRFPLHLLVSYPRTMGTHAFVVANVRAESSSPNARFVCPPSSGDCALPLIPSLLLCFESRGQRVRVSVEDNLKKHTHLKSLPHAGKLSASERIPSRGMYSR